MAKRRSRSTKRGDGVTYIAPLPKEAIADPELRALMAEAEALGVPDDLFPRILARAPEQAVPLMRALILSHAQGNVDHRLKEIMRILLDALCQRQVFREPSLGEGARHGPDRAAYRRGLPCLRG